MKPVNRQRIIESELRRKSKRGAERSKAVVKQKLNLPIGRVLMIATVIGGGWYLMTAPDWHQGYEELKQLVSRPIRQIYVQGEFQFLEKDQIDMLLKQQHKSGFVRLNLRDVKGHVENVPWVENVRISRVWPDGLVIKIQEQKPIARWGDSGFINQYGDIVKADQVESLKQLPVLYGPEEQSEEITRTYLEVAELMTASGVSLRGLYLDEKRAWTLQFNDDIEIAMGRDNVLKKLGNFLYVYDKKLKQYENEIARIDLRYDSGVAVRWKNKEEQLAKSDLDSDINKLLAKVN